MHFCVLILGKEYYNKTSFSCYGRYTFLLRTNFISILCFFFFFFFFLMLLQQQTFMYLQKPKFSRKFLLPSSSFSFFAQCSFRKREKKKEVLYSQLAPSPSHQECKSFGLDLMSFNLCKRQANERSWKELAGEFVLMDFLLLENFFSSQLQLSPL